MLSFIPASVRRQVWDLLRPYTVDSAGNHVRLRARDIPQVPFYAKPFIPNWTVRLDHALEWIVGHDQAASTGL